MDVEEAARIVYSKIQSLDPENASKIMSYLYIQEGKEKELIRLAFSSEPVLLSVINQAKIHCGLLSNSSSTPSTPSSPSPFNPLSNPNRLNPLSQSSPRIIVPNNGYHTNPSSPSSPWSASGFPDHRSPNIRMSPRPAYATVVNGNINGPSGSLSPTIGSSFSLPSYYSHSKINDYNTQVRGQLPFLDDSALKKVDFGNPVMSPGGRSDSFLHPCGDSSGNWDSGNCGDNHHHHLHKRSCSVSDAFLGGDGEYEDAGGGFGWRPCMYYARGFCKNGNSCKFMHGDFSDCPSDSSPSFVGSPSKFDGFDEEVLRIKMLQQQQQQQRLAFAAQLMAGGSFPNNKGMSFLGDSPRSEAASLMMGEEFHKFNRFRQESSDFLALFNGSSSSTSRQIYLTFPADSTFKEEDVSNYFSKFGPVQDVRIPYQQKRMFGFVTFLYPETVKMILAKGNPHFVCDSRVLVKPYKEKGKIPDKKQQLHSFERGDFPSCLSPGYDSREQFELPVGPRMLFNNQQMMLRRKLEEQAELQQAIELQGRRMMNMQLMDLKDGRHGQQFHPNMVPGRHIPIPSPVQSHFNMGEGFVYQNEGGNQENSEENDDNATRVESPTAGDAIKQKEEVAEANISNNGFVMNSGVGQLSHTDDKYANESFEHILPDNLFASPTKSANHHLAAFATPSADADNNSSVTSSNNAAVEPAASLDSSGEPCNIQTAR